MNSPAKPLVLPTLRTERLLLTPLNMTHSAGMFELWSAEPVARYSGPVSDANGERLVIPALDASTSDRIIDFWLKAAQAGWGGRWALIEVVTGRFVGIVGFNGLGARAEVAYHLVPAAWGRGLMTEAALAALEWARLQGCAEVEAFIDPQNEASIRLAQRLGMAPTGMFSDGAQQYIVKCSP